MNEPTASQETATERLSKPCRVCNGEGLLHDRPVGTLENPWKRVTVKCPDCQGSGRVINGGWL